MSQFAGFLAATCGANSAQAARAARPKRRGQPGSRRRAQPDEPPAEALAAVQLERVDSDEAEPQRLQSPSRLVWHREDPALLPVGLAEEQHGAVLAHLGD